MAKDKICGLCLMRGELVAFKTRKEIMDHLYRHIENRESERREWECSLQHNQSVKKERSEKHAEFLLWELSCEPRQDKD